MSEKLRSTSLLDSITIDHGPRDLLAQMFIQGESMARAKGLRLSFASLDLLADVNAQNRDSWPPLFSTYDPRFWSDNESFAFSIVGRNADGEVVATQGLRIFDWADSSYGAECEALRLQYEDPARDALPGETCRVSAAAAFRIRGRVAFSGGIWFRPDYRGLHLTGLMVRLGRAYALGRWNIDFLTAMMSEKVFAKGLSKQVGHFHVDEWVDMRNCRMGDVRFKLMWMDMAEMTRDMRAYLAQSHAAAAAQGDAVVEQGRAQ